MAVAIFTLAVVAGDPAAAQQLTEDATQACGRAATQAERDWGIPVGLLAAIGTVESGHRASTGMFPVIWPWTINAEGRGYYEPSKTAAIGVVQALRRRGVRVIDAGCFQVDLFYHPNAFASLEEAFDPGANAHAAARILSLGRLNSAGWDGAIAAYHSAMPLVGALYLKKVHAAWSSTRARPAWGQPDPSEAFAVLLAPHARLVKVVTPFNSSPELSSGLPDVMLADRRSRLDQTERVTQWLHQPPEDLPRVVSSVDARGQLLSAMRRRDGGP
jgi:hypothetical protein